MLTFEALLTLRCRNARLAYPGFVVRTSIAYLGKSVCTSAKMGVRVPISFGSQL
jgi:hypothetical protein